MFSTFPNGESASETWRYLMLAFNFVPSCGCRLLERNRYELHGGRQYVPKAQAAESVSFSKYRSTNGKLQQARSMNAHP